MKILPFCAIIVLIAGVTNGPTRAETARAQSGTLVIQVPRGLLPSDDYWVYVNGKMVSAPPRAPFVSLNSEFMHVSAGTDAAPRDEYRDAAGRVASSAAGRWTFYREGVKERVFDKIVLTGKAPGKYRVELMTRSENKPFPFTVAGSEVQAGGGSTEIELAIPPGTDEMYIVQALRCSACNVSIHPPAQTLDFIHADLNRTVAAFEANPMVPLLDDILVNLSITPGKHPTISAALPLAMGGGRELDGRQITLILTALTNNYEFSPIDRNTKLQGAEPPTPQLAAALSLRISKHNARIDNYRKIITALEQAKR